MSDTPCRVSADLRAYEHEQDQAARNYELCEQILRERQEEIEEEAIALAAKMMLDPDEINQCEIVSGLIECFRNLQAGHRQKALRTIEQLYGDVYDYLYQFAHEEVYGRHEQSILRELGEKI